MQLVIPPVTLRWGGPRYADDQTWIKAGVSNAQALGRLCGVSASSSILDIGCGQARLLNGLVAHFGGIRRYVGIDVHGPSIEWLKKNVEHMLPAVDFHHISMRNERYNPKGDDLIELEFRETFDCITLLSVFSHMRLADISMYLDFMRPLIGADGCVYLTAFVEDNVDPETVNPPNYYRDWSGPLHCVRIDRHLFERMAFDAGFQTRTFRYRRTADGQSIYVLEARGRPFAARVVKQ